MRSSYLINPEKPCKQRITIFDNSVDAKKLLNAIELANLIGVAPRTIYNWIQRDSSFPYVKLGKLVRFEIGKVLLWFENRSN